MLCAVLSVYRHEHTGFPGPHKEGAPWLLGSFNGPEPGGTESMIRKKKRERERETKKTQGPKL